MENIEQPVEHFEKEPVVEPVLEPVAVAEPVIEVPEFVYEYQPTDEHGRNLGSKQVFKGKDVNEVLQKVADANKNLIKLNRDMNKKIRLSSDESAENLEGTTRYKRSAEFKPKTLTDDEKYQASRDLLDPDKYDEATTQLITTRFGASPEEITERINRIQQTNDRLMAQIEAEAFVRNTPEYFGCPDNFEMITSWMIKNDLDPVRSNFKHAFKKLTEAGLLLDAPTREVATPVAEPVTQPVQDEPSRITVEKPAQRAAKVVASGLTNRNTSNSVGVPAKSAYTLEEIRRMPSDVYIKKMKSEPGFTALVDKLEGAAKR